MIVDLKKRTSGRRVSAAEVTTDEDLEDVSTGGSRRVLIREKEVKEREPKLVGYDRNE